MYRGVLFVCPRNLKKSRNQRIKFIFSFLVNPAINCCVYIFSLSNMTIFPTPKKKKDC